MSDVSKTFCPLPWKEISSGPTGSIRLCCSSVSEENISHHNNGTVAKIYDDLEESYNTDFFLKTRQDMLDGNPVSACKTCYKQEASGIESVRMYQIRNATADELVRSSAYNDISQVRELDLRLGRVCNLQCRMCSPYSSSSWESSWKQLGDLVTQPSEKAWENIRKNEWVDNPKTWNNLKSLVPNLKKVYLTGGEPFLIAANKDFLKYCVETGHSKKIELRYNTNGTIWDEELIQYWAHFKQVKLQFSVDGLGDLNNYIRFPSRWSSVIANIEAAQKAALSNPIIVIVTLTAQAYNVFQIPNIIDFFRQKGIYIYINMVQKPSFLSVGVLGPELAHAARENLRKEIDYTGISGIIHMLNSSHHHEWDHFVSYTKKLDEINKQNISDVVPELGI